MVSPVGVNVAQTFASVISGITRMKELPEIYYCLADDPDFEDGEPLVASPISYLDPMRKQKQEPVKWLAYIAAQAFFDLYSGIRLEQDDFQHIGLFMSLPMNRFGWMPEIKDEFIYHFHNFIETDIFPYEKIVFSGHAGGLSLFKTACSMIAGNEIKYALIGGVESYLFPDCLEFLDKEYRIKSKRNIDGFIPGECAAFILLELDKQHQYKNVSALAHIKNTASGQCSASELSFNTGSVLTEILSDLLDKESEPPVIICDLNGESSRMREWGYAVSRLGIRLGNPVILEHPAICVGDVGAASGAFLTALGIFFLNNKYRQKSSAIIWTGSDNGEREALLIEKP